MISGVYRLNFRGLSYAECWRFGGVLGFPLAVILKFMGKKGTFHWLPAHETEEICRFEELNAIVQTNLQPAVEVLQRLGYKDGVYMKMKINLDPDSLDLGAYFGLHENGMKFMHAAFNRRRVQSIKNFEMKTVFISGGIILHDLTSIQVYNHKKFMDDGNRSKKIVLLHATPEQVDRQLDAQISDAYSNVQSFSDVTQIKAFFREQDMDIWEERINRGLLVKVSFEEEHQIMNSFNVLL
jgi:hypothetical protein